MPKNSLAGEMTFFFFLIVASASFGLAASLTDEILSPSSSFSEETVFSLSDVGEASGPVKKTWCDPDLEDCAGRRELAAYTTIVSYNFLNRGYVPRSPKAARTYYLNQYTGAYAALLNGSRFKFWQ